MVAPPDLSTPITSDPPELPVEPDEGPVTPPGPADPAQPLPPQHPHLLMTLPGD